MSISIPIPENFLQSVWLALGIQFGRCFGKKLDYDIQNSEWFKQQHPLTQGIIKRLLDFTHHWWIGALLMIYITNPLIVLGLTFNLDKEFYWFGAGLLLDDLPDIPQRLSKAVKIIK